MSESLSKLVGIRAVAAFEGAKAVLLIVVGFGLISLVNRDVGSVAEHLVRRLHLNPVSHYPQIFVDAARHVTNANLWVLASLAMLDATGRGFVAYGLWGDRRWGKWLGVIIAGIYIPFEVYEIYLRITGLKVATFVTNVAIVVYLGIDLYLERHRTHSHALAPVDLSGG